MQLLYPRKPNPRSKLGPPLKPSKAQQQLPPLCLHVHSSSSKDLILQLHAASTPDRKELTWCWELFKGILPSLTPCPRLNAFVGLLPSTLVLLAASSGILLVLPGVFYVRRMV
jgi:hypothetical protein